MQEHALLETKKEYEHHMHTCDSYISCNISHISEYGIPLWRNSRAAQPVGRTPLFVSVHRINRFAM